MLVSVALLLGGSRTGAESRVQNEEGEEAMTLIWVFLWMVHGFPLPIFSSAWNVWSTSLVIFAGMDIFVCLFGREMNRNRDE